MLLAARAEGADQVRGLASLPVRHTAVCDPDGMEEALLAAYSA